LNDTLSSIMDFVGIPKDNEDGFVHDCDRDAAFVEPESCPLQVNQGPRPDLKSASSSNAGHPGPSDVTYDAGQSASTTPKEKDKRTSKKFLLEEVVNSGLVVRTFRSADNPRVGREVLACSSDGVPAGWSRVLKRRLGGAMQGYLECELKTDGRKTLR
jgi:hypothetical protein